MIGMDFPVSPRWIHDVLRLWQPEQSIGELVNAALSNTMQELGGEKTRRNSLSIILRTFVPTDGRGQTRRTTAQNLWAGVSASFSATVLGSAYLTQLIAHNEVAQVVSSTLVSRYKLGDKLSSGDIRRLLSARYGQRKVVLNSASAFLRSLAFFGVLAPGEGQGEYLWVRVLPVDQAVFPLLVWSWWQVNPVPQIDLDTFAKHSLFAFADAAMFPEYWRAYSGRLWSVEERLEIRRAAMMTTSSTEFDHSVSTMVQSGR